MSPDQRNRLEVLKAELDFVEKGGYGRSVRTPWQPTSIFRDSLSCLNFGDSSRPYPCEDCLLIDFVPEAERSEAVPCHFIKLDEEGNSVAALDARGDQQEIEERVKAWLREKISEMESEQPPQGVSAT